MFDLWKLKDFASGEGLARQVFSEQFDTSDWIDITVPGDVHQSLLEAGRLADPFYDRNEDKCAWMEEREWWYRISFAGEEKPLRQDERLLLVFEGLDTFVTIWLNGEVLGKQMNMFREVVFDVGSRLRSDRPNTLALCFHPPLQQAEKAPFESWGRNSYRVMMRKAQFGYGWDWGPRLPTIGIWRPIELRRQRYAAIQGMHFSTIEIDTNSNKALVAVQVDVERFAGEQAVELSITLLSPERAAGTAVVAEQTLTLQGSGSQLSAKVYIKIENPQLWWTHELGAHTGRYFLGQTVLPEERAATRALPPQPRSTCLPDRMPPPLRETCSQAVSQKTYPGKRPVGACALYLASNRIPRWRAT